MFEKWNLPFPKGMTLMIGVVAEHDSEFAEEALDSLLAWLMAHRGMPLMASKIVDDCLVSPPERGSKHVEIRWIQL